MFMRSCFELNQANRNYARTENSENLVIIESKTEKDNRDNLQAFAVSAFLWEQGNAKAYEKIIEKEKIQIGRFNFKVCRY